MRRVHERKAIGGKARMGAWGLLLFYVLMLLGGIILLGVNQARFGTPGFSSTIAFISGLFLGGGIVGAGIIVISLWTMPLWIEELH